MQFYAFGMSCSGDVCHQQGTDRISEGDVPDAPISKEGFFTSERSIHELIDQHECPGG